jgi:hypothetical protein
MALFVDQSAAAQTAFAGLSQAARQYDLRRSISDVPGGFAKKLIKGRSYWYHQVKMPGGKLQQVFVGTDDDETRTLIEQHADPAAKGARRHLAALCESAIALGCYGVIPKHARVLGRLADHGLFKAGGILVGTHAYLSYQNRFGVIWTAGDTTVDLDFAHPGKNISLAIDSEAEVDTHAAIESLKMGFLPVSGGTRYVKADEPDFDLDFLTSMHRDGMAAVQMPKLNVTLQPLKFLEFSMEAPIVAVLPTSSGPIIVNVPRPERYALAKLIVYVERLASPQPEKADKDLLQAASLIDYLSQNQADTLQEGWEDLLARGPGWRQRASQACAALRKKHPDIACAIAAPAST